VGAPKAPTKLDTDLNEQVNAWVYYILDHQTAEGWLGPDDGFGGKGNDYWTGWNVAAALLQYADANNGEPIADRCNKAVLDYITLVRALISHPTHIRHPMRHCLGLLSNHWRACARRCTCACSPSPPLPGRRTAGRT
jgi:hypothetical protein